MPNNYVLLETIALTQSAASVTFDNLPTSGYTDLKIVTSCRADAGSTANDGRMTFNGSSTGYSSRLLYGLGSGTPASASNSGSYMYWINATTASGLTANTFASSEIYIPNYRSSNQKSVSFEGVTENNGTYGAQLMTAGLWSGTAAITSISFALDYGNFVAGSTFSLYGVAAFGTTPVLAPKATGGNRVENDGTYWIHTFLTSGTFTPQVGLTCDYLVVAGGGGGGGAQGTNGSGGGGAGAGGFRTATSQLVNSSSSYSVLIGAGGVGTDYLATNGSDSSFNTLVSTGGGRGAGYDDSPSLSYNAGTGGSGGGGAPWGSSALGNTPSTSPSQGNNGGAYGSFRGGGGGGASVAGAAGSSGGNGGAGSSNSYSGTAVTYAGGGGGGHNSSSPGLGGAGGGGNGGALNNTGGNGTINTGGGGGGGGAFYPGGAGGSGIVIIRYPIN